MGSMYSRKESSVVASSILVALLALTIFFSSYFLSLDQRHDCSGEDCPICACLQSCRQLIRLAASSLSWSGPLFCLFCLLLIEKATAPSRKRTETLVTAKVRLDD